MHISSMVELTTPDVEKFTWTRLKNYKNISFTSDLISQLHSLPLKFRADVKKQSAQIRYALIQAEEYFDAAKTVSLATQPVLYYYGTMSLALAEILFKQTGDSSLDRARQQHAHHGLLFKPRGDPSSEDKLANSASLLRAIPMLKNNCRMGTFELWHRSSRESALAGLEEIDMGTSKQSRTSLLAFPSPHPFEKIPEKGFSLLECWSSIPDMSHALAMYGLNSELVRGTNSRYVNDTSKIHTNILTLHPSIHFGQHAGFDNFFFSPCDFELINIVEMPFGCAIRTTAQEGWHIRGGRYPIAFQKKRDEIFFCFKMIGSMNLV